VRESFVPTVIEPATPPAGKMPTAPAAVMAASVDLRRQCAHAPASRSSSAAIRVDKIDDREVVRCEYRGDRTLDSVRPSTTSRTPLRPRLLLCSVFQAEGARLLRRRRTRDRRDRDPHTSGAQRQARVRRCDELRPLAGDSRRRQPNMESQRRLVACRADLLTRTLHEGPSSRSEWAAMSPSRAVDQSAERSCTFVSAIGGSRQVGTGVNSNDICRRSPSTFAASSRACTPLRMQKRSGRRRSYSTKTSARRSRAAGPPTS